MSLIYFFLKRKKEKKINSYIVAHILYPVFPYWNSLNSTAYFPDSEDLCLSNIINVVPVSHLLKV